MTPLEAATGAFPDPDPLAYEKSDDGSARYRNAVLKVTYQREGYVKRMQEEPSVEEIMEVAEEEARHAYDDGEEPHPQLETFLRCFRSRLTALLSPPAPPVLPAPTPTNDQR